MRGWDYNELRDEIYMFKENITDMELEEGFKSNDPIYIATLKQLSRLEEILETFNRDDGLSKFDCDAKRTKERTCPKCGADTFYTETTIWCARSRLHENGECDYSLLE